MFTGEFDKLVVSLHGGGWELRLAKGKYAPLWFGSLYCPDGSRFHCTNFGGVLENESLFGLLSNLVAALGPGCPRCRCALDGLLDIADCNEPL